MPLAWQIRLLALGQLHVENSVRLVALPCHIYIVRIIYGK